MRGARLAHQHAQQLDLVAERGVADGHLDPGALLQRGLVVREAVEAHLAVVGAHAGVAHAAEAHVVVGQVDDDVVDGGAAERQLADDALLHGLVIAEHVCGQRLLERAHDGERLVQRLVRDDRQHGAENLLVHHRVVQRHAAQARGLDAQRACVAAPAERHRGIRVAMFDQPHHAFEVALADHVRPFVAREDVLAVILVEARVQLPHEVVRHALVHEKVVGRDARLPAVDALAPGHALRCALHVRRFVHDAGTLAAQLQHHGREVLRRRLHDGMAHVRAAGEEYLVPAHLQQPVVHRAGAGEAADELGREHV